MLQFKEIKKKHLGYFYTRLPSLQVLDVMNSRAVAIGWLFLTLGVIVGAVWTMQARPLAPADPNLRAMSLDDPKIFVAMLTLGHLFVRGRGAPHAGVDRAEGGVALGARLRLRDAELPADQVLRDHQPHVLLTCISSCSASATAPRPSTCENASTSRAATSGRRAVAARLVRR